MMSTPPDEIERAVRDAAAKVHIDHLLDAQPGPAFRRAAAARARWRARSCASRACSCSTSRLSNLDAKLRLETRVELRKLQRSLGVTAVYVTHDQEEAMTIADRMAVFMEGRIVQVGTPDEVFAPPGDRRRRGLHRQPADEPAPGAGSTAARCTARATKSPCRGISGRNAPVTLGIRPGALRLAADGMPARVYLVEHLGDSTIVNFQIDDLLLRMRSDKRPALSEGETVRLAFDPADAHLFDSETGLRL